MRFDIPSVFLHSFASLPARIFGLWIVGTLGIFIPVFISSGLSAFEIVGFQLLFFPIYLFIASLVSGWWSLIAVPLLIAIVWTSISYLRDEGPPSALIRIFLFSFLIGIGASRDRWPIAALIAIGGIYLTIKVDRDEGFSV